MNHNKPEIFRVFLCSTYSDLIDEREAVLDVIGRLQLVHHSMEFFGARPNCPLDTCLAEVRASDIVLVIVGHRYGTFVPGNNKSYVDLEYEEAWQAEKPCLVYFRSEDIPVLPASMERNPAGMQALDTLKEKLRERHTVATFDHSNDLAVAVAADLHRIIIQQHIEKPTSTENEKWELTDLFTAPLMICTSDNRIQNANESMAKLLGYTVTELIGKEIGSLCVTDSHSFGENLWELATRNQCRVDFWILRRDGNLVILDLILVIDGPRLLCLAQDITDRIKLEEVLRQSAHRSRYILEQTPAAILVFDDQMRCRFINQEAISTLNLSEESVFNMPLKELPLCSYDGRELHQIAENIVLGHDLQERMFLTMPNKEKRSLFVTVRHCLGVESDSSIYIVLAATNRNDPLWKK